MIDDITGLNCPCGSWNCACVSRLEDRFFAWDFCTLRPCIGRLEDRCSLILSCLVLLPASGRYPSPGRLGMEWFLPIEGRTRVLQRMYCSNTTATAVITLGGGETRTLVVKAGMVTDLFLTDRQSVLSRREILLARLVRVSWCVSLALAVPFLVGNVGVFCLQCSLQASERDSSRSGFLLLWFRLFSTSR